MQAESLVAVTPQFYDLELDKNLLQKVIIRNNRLWAILQNKRLIYADLTVRPKPQVRAFPESELSECRDIFVQPDGELCVVCSARGHFHVSAPEFNVLKTEVLPGTKITCATWYVRDKFRDPILFLGTDLGAICYHELNGKNHMERVNVLLVEVPPGSPIRGLAFVPFENGLTGLCVATQDSAYPFILDEQLVPVKDPKSKGRPGRVVSLAGVSENGVVAQGNLLGVRPDGNMILEFVLDGESEPREEKLLSKQIANDLPGEISGFCLFQEFLMAYDGKGQMLIYSGGKSPIVTETFPDAKAFDYDLVTGEVFAIYDNKVAKLRFDPTAKTSGCDSLRIWLYRKLMMKKKAETAVDILVKMKLSFDELLKMAGTLPQNRLRLYRNILAKMMAKKIFTKQTMAIAAVTLDMYARVESEKKEPDVEGFCKFVEEILEAKLVTMKSVNATLQDYGWEAPLDLLTDPITIFNKAMENADQEKAVDSLTNIRNDNEFSGAALRVYTYDETKVCNAVMKREDLSNSQLLPILMNEQCEDFNRQLFSTGRIKTGALCRVFALAISKQPDRERIETFFRDYYTTATDDISFMIRSLAATKNFKLLAYGLAARNDPILAASMAAREDPACAFDFLPADMEPDLKKRCEMKILRSLPQEDAEKLAKTLLDRYRGAGVDMATLLQFIPADTMVSDLAIALAEFVDLNAKRTEQQRHNLDEALEGIRRAQMLKKEREDKTVKLPSTQLCTKCKRPLFTEKGIVYPCSHLLHMRCAQKMADVIQERARYDEVKVDVTTDCPICGFLSVRMIDLPLIPQPKGVDPWTVDPHELPSLVNKGKSKHLGLFSFAEKLA